MRRLLPLIFCAICLLPSQVKGFWSVQAGASYFSPASHSIKKTYSAAMVDYQIEVSRTVFCDWDLFFDIDYMTQSGKLPRLHRSTDLNIVPLSLGMRYYIPVYTNTWWYVGGGGCYTFTQIHNNTDCLKKNMKKWAFGGVFKTGLKYYLNDSLYANFFVDYFYQHCHLTKSDRRFRNSCSFASGSNYVIGKDMLNVGGLKIGGALGWAF